MTRSCSTISKAKSRRSKSSKKIVRKAVIDNKIFPVFTGSALKNNGVQLVLDAVVDYLPSPLDMPPVKGINPNTGEEIFRHASDDRAFLPLWLSNSRTIHSSAQLTFFRVYSGTIEAGTYIYNSTTGKKERLGRIVRLQADKREEVKKVFAGEIAAAVGLKDALTSNTFCDEEQPDHSRSHQIHGAGRVSAHRAKDQSRPGEDGHGAAASSATKIRHSKSPPIRKQARLSFPAWASFTSRSWLTA